MAHSRIINLLATVALTLVLATGCGFHLRGKFEISDSLQNIYLSGPDRDLIDELEDNLDFSGVTVAPSEEDANAVLRFIEVLYERDVKTLDDRGRASSYELIYRIAFNVFDSSGNKLIDRSLLKITRDFIFDSTQVLQKEDEEDFLKEDMLKDAAQQIMRRLSKI